MIIASLLMLFGQGQTPFYSPTIEGVFDTPDLPDPCTDTPTLPDKVWFCPPAPVDSDWYWVIDTACKAQAEADFLAAAQACYDVACLRQEAVESGLEWCLSLAQTVRNKIYCHEQYEAGLVNMMSIWASCLGAAYSDFMSADCCVKVYY